MKRFCGDYEEKLSKDRRSGKDRRMAKDNILISANKRSHNDRRSKRVRRRYNRFQVRDSNLVKLWPESEEGIGQLLDISSKGLSFRYIPNDGKPREFSKLSILLSNGDCSIDRIPIQKISDTAMADESAPSCVNFRRHGARYGDLTSRQAFEMDYFLESQILGETHFK